jgi:hypothetical protein
MPRYFAILALLLYHPAPALAQLPEKLSDLVDVRASVFPPEAKRGQTVTYRITVAPKPGAWTYPITGTPGQSSKIALVAPPPGDLVFVTEAKDPPGYEWGMKFDQNDFTDIKYTKEPITWEMSAVVSPKATPGKKTVRLDRLTNLPACNDQACLNSTADDLPVAEFEVLDGEPVPVEEQYRAAVEKALGPAVTPPGPRSNNDGPGPLGPKPSHAP